MTRFVHDKFAKDYLEELLSPYGKVQAPRRVAGEARQIDVWFAPASTLNSDIQTLGLLGRFAASAAIFEPFRNAAIPEEICDCLLKLLEIKGELQREAKRNNNKLQESDLPNLWILTPTASVTLLAGFGATIKEDWLSGIYFMPEYLRTALVVIHQLPRTPETLWLRILGRGTVQKQAIDELERLPVDDPLRDHILQLLYSLQKDLEVTQEQDEEDRELIMRLSPLYLQDREKAVREGQQQVIENLLRVRFGALDEELLSIVESLLTLSPEEFTPLLLQLSREELLARFQENQSN
jgi:hypothetical protein